MNCKVEELYVFCVWYKFAQPPFLLGSLDPGIIIIPPALPSMLPGIANIGL